jgi:solute carrier family 25 carnitine/acylcarnitine transporter 20/29
MSDPRLQRMSPMENTAIGLATGAIDVSTTQWVLYCKNASQQGLPLTMNPRILYRGYTMSLTNMMVLSGLQFPLTGLAAGVMTGGTTRKLSDMEEIGSGFIGGVLSGFICAPMELVMIQQQRYGSALFATPGKIIADNGVGTLFSRGLAMSCGREGVFTAGMLGLGPTLRRQAEEAGYAKANAAMLGALGGGVVVATLSHPMDTIKTCQQGDVSGKTYRGVVHAAQTLLKEAGPKRFFSGWAWRTGRMVFQCFLFDACKNHLSPVFFPHHFRDD